MLVFYHGGITVRLRTRGWGPLAAAMVIAVTFLAPFVYDALHKSPLGKDPKTFGGIAFVLVAVVAFLMARWAGFSYRSYNIHLAVMFGTIMAWNVWFRIWPAQQKILRAVKDGTAPDAALVALAGARSRHNTYMSVPLVWGMLNSHTTYFAGGNLGIPDVVRLRPLPAGGAARLARRLAPLQAGREGEGLLSCLVFRPLAISPEARGIGTDAWSTTYCHFPPIFLTTTVARPFIGIGSPPAFGTTVKVQ